MPIGLFNFFAYRNLIYREQSVLLYFISFAYWIAQHFPCWIFLSIFIHSCIRVFHIVIVAVRT